MGFELGFLECVLAQAAITCPKLSSSHFDAMFENRTIFQVCFTHFVRKQNQPSGFSSFGSQLWTLRCFFSNHQQSQGRQLTFYLFSFVILLDFCEQGTHFLSQIVTFHFIMHQVKEEVAQEVWSNTYVHNVQPIQQELGTGEAWSFEELIFISISKSLTAGGSKPPY